MTARRIFILALAATTIGAAGCASDDDADDATETTEEAGTETGTTDDTDDGADGADVSEGSVVVIDTDLGEVLATDEGLVLYIFDDDEPGVSNCVDGCLAAWPALDGSYDTWPDSVEVEIDTITRDDGTEQVTADGLPVYLFASDEEGTVTGQGVGGVWWVLNSDGTPNRSEG